MVNAAQPSLINVHDCSISIKIFKVLMQHNFMKRHLKCQTLIINYKLVSNDNFTLFKNKAHIFPYRIWYIIYRKKMETFFEKLKTMQKNVNKQYRQ